VLYAPVSHNTVKKSKEVLTLPVEQKHSDTIPLDKLELEEAPSSLKTDRPCSMDVAAKKALLQKALRQTIEMFG